ncbi:DUF3667 domain-containing protein [Pedobacter antarcticus]|uniref:DUF3667 domain-containing protein n=1 Tax=Pedobacter antarcticus TaxID=34086 RepID=UPI001C5899F2|nr:DUF3667 domain-containing protein [Pedobacter antarcticus]
MSGKYRKEKNCLNCGHEVESHYCSQCGQPNLELKEPFWGFIGHSIGHYFHFDSKFFQTLVPLLTQPGQVTLDYLAGKRARYIHPVSLYIFVSIVYFIIVPHTLSNNERDYEPSKTETAASLDSLKKELDIAQGNSNKISGYAMRRLSDALSLSDFRKLTFSEQQKFLTNIQLEQEKNPTDAGKKLIGKFQKAHIVKQDSTVAAYNLRQSKLPATDRDDWFTHLTKEREVKILEKKSDGDWSLKEEVKKYQPKQFFLLMPLLALFIMWNFRKNKIYYIDHLVFTIHGMTAFFLVSIVTSVLQRYIFGLDTFMSMFISFLLFAFTMWYLYSGLKLFYNRSRATTIRKTMTLVIMYFLAFGLTQMLIESAITYLLI